MKILALLFLVSSTVFAKDVAIGQPHLKFTHQVIVGEQLAYACQHKKASVGLYEWEVFCDVAGKTKEYWVHLVLSRYEKTTEGRGAYELLYWVTDVTDMRNPLHDSITLWIHNSTTDNKMRVIQTSLGVEDDAAYLKLKITLPGG